MAQNNLTFACLFLVLIFCQEIQCIEGRPLKLERQNQFPRLQTYSKILEKKARKPAGQNSYATVKAANADVSPPTAPSVQAGKYSPRPPPSPPTQVPDFRHTAPGHSAGVGHSFQNQFPRLQTHSKILEKETRKLAGQNNYATVKAANANVSSPPPPPSPPRQADDFRPTAPGHSPGVGHSLQN